MNKIRVAFIGAGFITEYHARALSLIPDVEIVAWCARSPKSAEKRARQFGGEICSMAEILKRKDIEAILVCSPTHLHYEHVSSVLKSSKRVFCEKPFTRTLEEAKALMVLGQNEIYVGHVLRFFQQYSLAREMVIQGELGNIYKIICRRLNSNPEGSQNWFNQMEKSGGVLLDLLIHDFDWLLWTFGQPESLKVQTFKDKDPKGWLHALVTFTWNKGMMAEVEGSWLHDRFEHHLLVESSKGRLKYSPEGNNLILETDRSFNKIPLDATDPYELQMRNFVGWLKGDQKPGVTLQEAYQALEISLRALDTRS
ncbi:MAG: gfo/Idh/MocA family oxidoreductase [Calditrichaeota bacterium]|nr:MAG: gfo/Idh/MocA family oxidoreductase [Calditrichota bacterium]